MNNLDLFNFRHIVIKDIDNAFETIPASIYCKDKKGRYLDCNKIFLSVSDSKSNSDVIGNSDFDLIWSKHASTMYTNDLAIIKTGKPESFVEQANDRSNHSIFYLSYKAPLRLNSKKIVGVVGFSFPLDKSLLENHFQNSKNNFLNPHGNNKYNLTKRQIECLHYLARGMTMKQIAKVLSLSPKTIEHHFDAIKNKIGCTSRYELIQIALDIKN